MPNHFPTNQPHQKTKPHQPQRTLLLEYLELRCLLTGMCDVEFEKGHLSLDCDGEDNNIALTGTESGEVMIAGNDGTLFRPAAPISFAQVTDVKVKLRGGHDVLIVDSIDIINDLEIDAGDDSNVNIVRDSTIGDDLRIRNGDTDQGTNICTIITCTAPTTLVTGQYNLVHANTIGDNLEVKNGDSKSTSSEDDSESIGNYTSIVANVSIGGNVRVANDDGESTTAAARSQSTGNYTTIASNGWIHGDIKVKNDDGRSATLGRQSDEDNEDVDNSDDSDDLTDQVSGNSTGNHTDIVSNAWIGGTVKVENVEARSSTRGYTSNSVANYTAVAANEWIGEDVKIESHEGESRTEGAASSSFGNVVLVSANVIYDDLDVENDESHSFTLGEDSYSIGSVTTIEENAIGDDVEVDIDTGKSSTNGANSPSYGNVVTVDSNALIGDDIEIDIDRGYSRTVGEDSDSYGNLTVVRMNASVGGDVEIKTRSSKSWTVGDDSVALDNQINFSLNTISGDLSIESKKGADEVIIFGTLVSGATKVKLGKLDDRLSVLDSIFAGRVKFDGGDGFDELLIGDGSAFPDGSPKLKNFENVLP